MGDADRKLLKSCLVGLLCLPVFVSGFSALAGQGQLIKSYEVENAAYNACLSAKQQMDAGAYSKARDILLEATKNDPTSYSSVVHDHLARCYKSTKDYPKAASEAETALQFNPQNQQALYLLATTYNEMGQYDKAIKVLNQLLKITDDASFATQLKALVRDISIFKRVKQAEKCINAENYSQARPLLEQAAAMDPSDFSGSIHSNLAYILQCSGQPERAIEEGKKALQFNPKDETTVYCLGIAYQDIGKFDEAISWLRRYVSMETDSDRRDKANTLINELADDKAKQDPAANSKPNYLAQLQSKNAAFMWPQDKMPLKVYIASGKDVPGYRPLFKPFIIRSLNTWCEVSGKKLSYKLVDDKKAADLTVSWTHDPLPMEEGGRTRQKAGLTKTRVDESTGKLNHASVKIRTVNGFEPNKLISDGEASTVSMHEIGHALGLGHSTCYSDIMYFGSSSKQTGFPTSRDKGTIAALYSSYPAISFTSPPAAIPANADIKYLPPPAFMPPVPSSMEKLPPPMFMPPPAKAAGEKLSPPVFVPPPLKKSGSDRPATPPMFVPPPK
ncbi:MAG: tetratricopeptide repeat protein [Cyanobacteria bacterium SZAS TMP-1]|nr:tetratricopeptide repeat protein [Cyanobacteria bacterium SZAS TMP-1]